MNVYIGWSCVLRSVKGDRHDCEKTCTRCDTAVSDSHCQCVCYYANDRRRCTGALLLLLMLVVKLFVLLGARIHHKHARSAETSLISRLSRRRFIKSSQIKSKCSAIKNTEVAFYKTVLISVKIHFIPPCPVPSKAVIDSVGALLFVMREDYENSSVLCCVWKLCTVTRTHICRGQFLNLRVS